MAIYVILNQADNSDSHNGSKDNDLKYETGRSRIPGLKGKSLYQSMVSQKMIMDIYEQEQ